VISSVLEEPTASIIRTDGSRIFLQNNDTLTWMSQPIREYLKKTVIYFSVFSSKQGTSLYKIYVVHLHASVTCYYFNLVLQIMNI
jgi:hypothetical protein